MALGFNNLFKKTGITLCLISLIVIGMFTVSPQAHAAVSTPVGEWSVNANGYTGTLDITAMNTYGVVYGDILGNPLVGFWQADTNRLTFLRYTTTDFSYFQIYVGHLNGDALYGTFEGFYGLANGHSDSTSYSWVASLSSTITPVDHPTSPLNGLWPDWRINVYNFRSEVHFQSQSSTNIVTGSVWGNPLLGKYNPSSNSISFVRADTADFSYFQIYSGYLPYNGPYSAPPGSGTFWEFFGPTNGSSNGPFSWHATQELKF